MILDRVNGRVERNYPLCSLTTWKIGGPGEYVYWPADLLELQAVWQAAKENFMPVWLIGRGSNLLIADQGLPGIVIVTTDLQNIEWHDHMVKIEAGYSLARLALEAGERGWSGLEFARGIPGTVGGALAMNAGAHGDEIASRVISVCVLDENGEFKTYKRSDLNFQYRGSSLKDKAWILEAELSFKSGDKEHILNMMKHNLEKRRQTQPLNLPNAGSVFRNPPGDSAGRLIELAGWKGKCIGGAQVSEKHANFIVNTGDASAQDVLSLVKAIQNDINNKFGVELNTEIQYLAPRG